MGTTQLSPENLELRDVASDAASMAERIEAYRERQPTGACELIVKPGPHAPATGTGEIPEVTPQELNADILREAMQGHGALLVRGLFPSDVVDALPGAIDRSLEAVALPPKEKKALSNAFFSPPENLVSILPDGIMELAALRMFNTRVGAVMAAEAPSVAEALLELFEAHGIKELVTEYLGEAPCLSVKKWVLRRSVLPVEEDGWHQDGAFMGRDINTINLWLPLTECGGDTGAPGMDLVPQRLNDIASAEGATFDWSVSDSHINSSTSMNTPVAPVFHSGDAFFFDHFYLHRTQYREDFTTLRYAIETWFFGESMFSKSQIPLAW